jgi:type I restriction enzyme S subunit
MKQPVDLRPDHAKIVHEVIARHLPAGVSVRVFGSRAKWTAKPHSDLDLALKGKEPLPRSVLGDLAEAFSESDLPFRVDVVDWHSVSPSFQAVIDRDAVALGWQVAPLEDCLESLIDYRGKSPTKSSTGIPVLSAKVVKTTGLIRPIEQTIAPEYYPKWMTRGLPKPGDVVMTTEAPMGEVIQLDAETARYALGQRIVCMRGKSGHLDNTFLRYLLTSPKQQDILASYATGTTVLGISQKALRSMPISFPAIEEQGRIGALLSALDDKIELNRRMNETLERQAQAIFRDWFVDFGPVRRKSAGETDAAAIMGGLTPDPVRAAQLAALFPDAFGDDGLPVGWAETAIGDLVKPQGGSTPSTGDETLWSPPRHYWATPKDLSNMTDLALFDTARQISDAGLAKITSGLLPPGSVLLSSRAPIGYLAITQVPVAINQGFIGLVPTAEVGSSYLYCWCKANMDKIVANANGSTFQEISKKNFRPITSAFPADRRLIAEFGLVADPLFARLIAAAIEIRTLTETRDYLLPRLMSGTVRVARESEAA